MLDFEKKILLLSILAKWPAVVVIAVGADMVVAVEEVVGAVEVVATAVNT